MILASTFVGEAWNHQVHLLSQLVGTSSSSAMETPNHTALNSHPDTARQSLEHFTQTLH